MRDNVKATKALADEYLGARRNVFNDAGEEYEHPHPQLDMFADLEKFSLRYNPGEDEVIDRFVQVTKTAKNDGVPLFATKCIGVTLGLALSYDLSVETRKKAMTLFCDIYEAATL